MKMLLKRVFNCFGYQVLQNETLSSINNELAELKHKNDVNVSRLNSIYPSKAIAELESRYDAKTTKGFVADGISPYILNPVDYCHVELEVAHMWYAIAKVTGVKRILETGVYFGYTTTWLAKAIQENMKNAEEVGMSLPSIHGNCCICGTIAQSVQ